jgi:hypothetical protein
VINDKNGPENYHPALIPISKLIQGVHHESIRRTKKMTTVVADSGDIESIRQFSPQDATINPSLILKAAVLPQYKSLIDHAINYAHQQGGDRHLE